MSCDSLPLPETTIVDYTDSPQVSVTSSRHTGNSQQRYVQGVPRLSPLMAALEPPDLSQSKRLVLRRAAEFPNPSETDGDGDVPVPVEELVLPVIDTRVATHNVALWLSLAPLPLLLVLAVASCIQGAYPLTAPHLAAALLLVSYKAASSICETPHVYASRALLGVFAVYCLVFDWVAEGEVGAWVGCVLVANVFGLLRHHTLMKVCVAVLLLYLALKGVEELLGESFVRAKPSEHYAGIGVGWALQNFVCRAGVGVGCVVFTFLVGRVVYSRLEGLQAQMVSSLYAADCLCSLNVEQAEAFLMDMEEDALRRALIRLADKLRQSRSFIPDHFCVDTSSVDPTSPCSPQHGIPAPHGRVAMVFTDIESSTRLWEMSPYSMKEALNLHNITTRRVMARFKGYEVKTLGDAFMVAFDSALSAVQFCVVIQEQLMKCEWPPEILAFAECSTVKGAWCGLRVRMGVHVGEMEREENPVTGRVDYFGVTVNKAARVQGVAQGGAIAVTDEVLAEVSPQPEYCALEVEVIDKGCHPLRGLCEECHVQYLLPASLHTRRQSLNSGVAAEVPQERGRTRCSVVSRYDAPRRASRGSIGSRIFVKKAVTVCNVLVDYSQLGKPAEEDPWVDLMYLVATFTDTVSRCDGWLVSVGSTAMYSSWNTCRKCVHHLYNAVGFASRLQRQLTNTLWDGRVWMGLSTGGVMHGHVGYDEKHYMIVGCCMDWCKTAATVARSLGAACLHAALSDVCRIAQDTGLKTFVRPVDEWTADSECRKVVRVEQVNLTAVGSESWALSETQTDWTWTDTYRKAFHSRDIMKLSTSNDPVVKRVLVHMKSEDHLGRAHTPGLSCASSATLNSSVPTASSSCASRTHLLRSCTTEMEFY